MQVKSTKIKIHFNFRERTCYKPSFHLTISWSIRAVSFLSFKHSTHIQSKAHVCGVCRYGSSCTPVLLRFEIISQFQPKLKKGGRVLKSLRVSQEYAAGKDERPSWSPLLRERLGSSPLIRHQRIHTGESRWKPGFISSAAHGTTC